MAKRLSPLALIAVLTLVLALGTASAAVAHRVFVPLAAKSSPPAAEAWGTLAGSVNIGPLCPVEPCPGPVPDVYSTRQIVLRPPAGDPVLIPLRPDGTFQATVRAGTYSLDLTDCTFLGCRWALPMTVRVEPNRTTTVRIVIDTGIR